MPLYRYEIADHKDVYGFSIIAPDDSTARRLAKALGKAVFLGEATSPDATELDVFKKMLN